MMPSWMGTSEEEKLPGERIAAIVRKNNLQPNNDFRISVSLPEQRINHLYTEDSRDANHPSLPEKTSLSQEFYIGTSIPDGYRLPVAPIIAAGKIFTIDGEGLLSAYDLNNPENPIWTKKTLSDRRYFLSGGINFYFGKLYVTTAEGNVICLAADSGEEIWKKFFNTPLRSAPSVKNNIVVFSNIQNEAYGLDAETGTTLWTYAGVVEEAGVFGSAAPLTTENFAFIPLSSGEVFALDLKSGQPVWTDSLVTKIKAGTGGFSISDINATPVQYKNTIIFGSSQNILTAKEVSSGRDVWEKNISILKTPWISGDFIYLITTQDELLCIYAPDGRIKWISQLPQFENEEDKKGKISYTSPVLAGNRLIVASSNGKLMEISPFDGNITSKKSISEDIFLRPAVANNSLFLLDNSGKLYIYK